MNVGREFIGSVYLSIASANDFQRKLDDYDTRFDAEGGSPVVAIEGAKGEKFVMPEKFTWVGLIILVPLLTDSFYASITK